MMNKPDYTMTNKAKSRIDNTEQTKSDKQDQTMINNALQNKIDKQDQTKSDNQDQAMIDKLNKNQKRP